MNAHNVIDQSALAEVVNSEDVDRLFADITEKAPQLNEANPIVQFSYDLEIEISNASREQLFRRLSNDNWWVMISNDANQINLMKMASDASALRS